LRKKDSEITNREIINLTPGGSFEVFESQKFEKVFGK